MKLPKRLLAALLGCSALGIAASHEAPATPKNLQVLPKDSSGADVKILMDRYGQELGVTCDYCHTENPQTHRPDYVSDDNPAKQTARVMIAMLDEINSKYLAQLDDQKYAVPVSCGNCHRGQADPPTFEAGVVGPSGGGLRAGGG